ncbi:MAG: hypothetical protein ACJAYK_000750 [Crocinitomicaceae bacterium]
MIGSLPVTAVFDVPPMKSKAFLPDRLPQGDQVFFAFNNIKTCTRVPQAFIDKKQV